MSNSNTHQQSLVDAGYETRPPMLERGSDIPWASRFRRYLNRKIENKKWLNKAIDEGDDLKHYEVEIEAINLILISIPNEIYNSVDACTTAKAVWKRVDRLMRGTVQNKVDRETRFNNEFNQFVAESREAYVSIYNHFAQLINDLEQNSITFPLVTVNTKFLNCLQPEWMKYVTQVRLAKRLTEDTYDDLFDYLQQFEKLVITYRSKKLEKSHDPLALMAHTGSLPELHHLTMSHIRLRNQAIVQADRVHIQSRNSGNDGRITRRSYFQEEVIECNNVQNDARNIHRTLRTTSSGTAANVQCYNCNEKCHYARNCPKPRVRDSKYFMEQMLLAKQDEAGVTLIDEHNEFLYADATRMEEIKELNVNSGSVEHDNNVQASYALEQLALNAYKEAEKQQINADKHVSQKKYEYSEVRAQNQDLLITISELKAKLKNVDKEEKHVLSKTVTLQTSPNNQKAVATNNNVIAPGMYKVNTKKKQETTTNKAKSVLSSTGLIAASSVRGQSSRDSSFKNSVLDNTNNSLEKVEVSDRKNKKPDVASKNVVLNNKIVAGVDVKNALKAKDVLCVSCAKDVLISCHDKCFANYKLNVHSKVRRALFTTPRTVKSKFEDTTPVVSKTRSSVKTTHSKSLDTTTVVSKTKIVAVTLLSAKNKVSMVVQSIWLVIVHSWKISLRNSWAQSALGTIILQQSQAMAIMYNATSQFVIYIMLKA
ncbi:retrovirus-related pol polyprotein from transposon TNT 1-94 [Tanacetum coccineum]